MSMKSLWVRGVVTKALRTKRTFWLYVGPLALTLSVVVPAHAAWSTDPTVNTDVCTEIHPQNSVGALEDGSGGVFVVWNEYRDDAAGDIYMQRLDGAGDPMWTLDGVPIVAETSQQLKPVMCSDGAGGVIVAWTDRRSGYVAIYVQRVDGSGVPQWAANGVRLGGATLSDTNFPAIIEDGTGGAIVAWQDKRNGLDDIFVRRVTFSGVAQWTSNGVPLCIATGAQTIPVMCSDGAGGAIVAWTDGRVVGNLNIYARRVSSTGTPQWLNDGIAICVAARDQENVKILPDGSGGAFLAWADARQSSEVIYDVYVQRVSDAGTVQWAANGIEVTHLANWAATPAGMVSDGSGGFILIWSESRVINDSDVFAQRVDDTGSLMWASDGIPMCTAALRQAPTQPVSDGAGGAIVFWADQRGGCPQTSCDIYGQRVSAAGAVLWNTDGVEVSIAPEHTAPPAAVANGAGGAIACFSDYRDVDTGAMNVYAQSISASGELGSGTVAVPEGGSSPVILRLAQPNPFHSQVRLELALAAPGESTVSVHDVQGRLVRTLSKRALPAGPTAMKWDARDDRGRRVTAGVYLIHLEAAETTATWRVVLSK